MSDPGHDKLARARQHVASGRRILAAQESLVQDIKSKGADAREAESILDSFRQTQAHFEEDLRRLAQKDN